MISLTRTQLDWAITALQHDVVRIRADMESADDDSPIVAIGECVIAGRQDLIRKLEDIVNGKQKMITIK